MKNLTNSNSLYICSHLVSDMSVWKIWILVALVGLGGRISPLNAKTPPAEDAVPLKASDVRRLDPGSRSPGASNHSAGLQSAPAVGIPLSLSPDSVDDMYYGCSLKMLIKVKQRHLHRSATDALHAADTKRCALRAMRIRDSDDLLSWDHFRALCAYTAGAYDGLNRAARQGRASYRTSFQFHALHFLLSDAIRLLKLNQRSCYTSYRRSKLLFGGELGQTVRFGSFASSSLSEGLGHFGRKTCFQIRTCFGAHLKSYTEFDSDEDEVLIPPYEMFSIVSVDTSGQNHLRCELFYQLETAGIYSNTNCQAVDI